MRKRALVTAGLVLLLLLGCSKAEPGGEANGNAQDGAAGPDVGVTAVPGLAVTYLYRYRLPVAEVARTQEAHAVQCEALGVARCRIVGLDYHAGAGRSISASLELRLAPTGARAFGREAGGVVARHGGMLTDAEVRTTDAGAAKAAAARTDHSLGGEATGIQATLARPGLPAAERAGLEERLAAVRDQRRGTDTAQADAAAMLASTPMRLEYQSGVVDPGYADGPILGGIKDGWRNVVLGTGTLLTTLITLLPWAAALGLLLWLWRRFGRRLGLRGVEPD